MNFDQVPVEHEFECALLLCCLFARQFFIARTLFDETERTRTAMTERMRALSEENKRLTQTITTLEQDAVFNEKETLAYQTAAEARILDLDGKLEQVEIDNEHLRGELVSLEKAHQEERVAERKRLADTVATYRKERDAERTRLLDEIRELREAAAAEPVRDDVEAVPDAEPEQQMNDDLHQGLSSDEEGIADAHFELPEEDAPDDVPQCLWWTRHGHRPAAKACAGQVVDQFHHANGAFKLCQQHTCARQDEGCRLVTRPTGRRCSACSRTEEGKERVKRYDSNRHRRVHY
jgi:hypothetical protein